MRVPPGFLVVDLDDLDSIFSGLCFCSCFFSFVIYGYGRGRETEKAAEAGY